MHRCTEYNFCEFLPILMYFGHFFCALDNNLRCTELCTDAQTVNLPIMLVFYDGICCNNLDVFRGIFVDTRADMLYNHQPD